MDKMKLYLFQHQSLKIGDIIGIAANNKEEAIKFFKEQDYYFENFVITESNRVTITSDNVCRIELTYT